MASLTAVASNGSDAIELAKIQSALADVVIPDQARQAERYAAKELSDYHQGIPGGPTFPCFRNHESPTVPGS
jgi:hypothetical protein